MQRMVLSEGLLGPFVLLHDLGLLLGSEIVLDVEELADLLDALALDEGGDLSAGQLEKGLDVEEVGGHDDFEEHLLVHVNVVCMPLVDHLGQVVGAEGLLDLGWSVVLHVLHEDNDFLHDGLVHLGDGDLLINATVLNEALDEH